MAKLIVNPTSSSRRDIHLPRSLLSIGRDPSNDIVLPDAMVSRRHAVIEYRGSQFFLRDCNSSNGSLVNGDRVSERNLRDGDLVAIGTARLLFRDDVEDPSAKVVQHPSAPRLDCPTCGADYRKGDLYCKQCGGQLAPATPAKAVCPSCGTAVALPAKFCNACGASLGEAAKGENPTQSRPILAEGLAVVDEGAEPTPLASLVDPEGPEAAPAPLTPLEETVPPPAPEQASRPPEGGTRQGPSAAAVPAAPRPRPAAEFLRPKPTPAPRAVAPPGVRPTPPERVPEKRFDVRSASAGAGFGRRCAAGLVDGLIVLAIVSLVVAPVALYWWSRTPGEVSLLPILLSAALAPLGLILVAVYYAYFWGVQGASPGKRLLGLVVVGTDGQYPIGVTRAAVRVVGYLLSGAILGIGFLMIAFGGQGLHDRVAGTRVVRREGS